jgi:hypothetical protein
LLASPRGAWRISYAAAWAIVVALAASPRPAGGYAVAGNLEGYLMIFWAVLMIVVATVTVSRVAPRADPDHPGE